MSIRPTSAVLQLAVLYPALLPPMAPRGEGAADVTIYSTPDRGRPVTARAGGDGTVHLLYDLAGGPRYAKSADGGATFGPPVLVVNPGPYPEGLVFAGWDLAVGKGGRVHVALGTNAWKLKRPQEEWGFYYASLDPGAQAFSPARNLNRKPSEGFSLAADGEGNVTACWLSGQLYANVSRDGGRTFGPNAEIDPSFDPCDCCTTSAAYGRDGRLAVLYREEARNERDMYLVLWDQAGGTASRTRVGSTPWKVDGCPMTYYSVSHDRGGFVAAWPTKGDVYFARLDGAGAPTGRAEVKTPGKSGMRNGVLALSAPDGRVLVAWKKDGRLGWQVYDPKGLAAGEPGSAPSEGGGVAGLVDGAGRFVLFR